MERYSKKKDREFLKAMHIESPTVERRRQTVTAEDDVVFLSRLLGETTEQLVRLESRYERFRAATIWLGAGLVAMVGLLWVTR